MNVNIDLETIINRFAESVSGVLRFSPVNYNENLVLASGCSNYGCTCISYEKCCGCFIQ